MRASRKYIMPKFFNPKEAGSWSFGEQLVSRQVSRMGEPGSPLAEN